MSSFLPIHSAARARGIWAFPSKPSLHGGPEFRYNPRMAKKSISVIPKKRGRGRPATGKDPLVALRLPPSMIASVDGWAKRSGAASRSEAIRELIERGLKDG